MDADQIFNSVPAINSLSTIVAIGCVFPTYFLSLRPPTYRWILSLGIVSGLSTLLAVVIATFLDTAHDQLFLIEELLIFSPVLGFAPFNIVLIAILAGIRWVTRVSLWSTAVLASVVLNWAGMSCFFWILS